MAQGALRLGLLLAGLIGTSLPLGAQAVQEHYFEFRRPQVGARPPARITTARKRRPPSTADVELPRELAAPLAVAHLADKRDHPTPLDLVSIDAMGEVHRQSARNASALLLYGSRALLTEVALPLGRGLWSAGLAMWLGADLVGPAASLILEPGSFDWAPEWKPRLALRVGAVRWKTEPDSFLENSGRSAENILAPSVGLARSLGSRGTLVAELAWLAPIGQPGRTNGSPEAGWRLLLGVALPLDR